MRIVFAGSPEIALPALRMLAARHEIAAALTNPASSRGRGLCEACTPVAEAAQALGIPVLAPQKLGPAEREIVAGYKPELLVVFAYGTIFGPKFMALFKRGGINAHPSLLPRWRGCAPIPYAILHGDARTGISIQRITPVMDTGDILARRSVELGGAETCRSLSEWASTAGAELLLETVDAIACGTEQAEAQDESQATYCAAIKKDDGLIDWKKPAAFIEAMVRAFYPWPCAYTMLKGTRLTIHEAGLCPVSDTGAPPGTLVCVDKSSGIMVQTGEGLLALRCLQLQGKKPLQFKDFMNGARCLEGAVLGE